MWVRAIGIGLAIALAASPVLAQTPRSKAPPAIPEPILVALKSAAGKKLKDPYSAQYERLQRATRPNARGEPTDVVCGYVNAKNSYGAYIGAKPFLYFVARQELHMSGADDTLGIVPAMLTTFCTGLI